MIRLEIQLMTHLILSFTAYCIRHSEKVKYKVSLLIHCIVSASAIVFVIGTLHFIYNTNVPFQECLKDKDTNRSRNPLLRLAVLCFYQHLQTDT